MRYIEPNNDISTQKRAQKRAQKRRVLNARTWEYPKILYIFVQSVHDLGNTLPMYFVFACHIGIYFD